ncbi:MAG: DUF4982 domain-containing protein, partial [Pontiellaceae bacterium]|nr:DUF4982 domain-containing protein [Pontiellaceae bacterium]
MRKKRSIVLLLFGGVSLFSAEAGAARERICINDEWRFHMGDAGDDSTGLIYDVRPDADYTVADAEPTDAEKTARTSVAVLKSWILSSGNRFIQNPWQRHVRTEAAPPCDGAPYVLDSFDDSIWQKQDLTPYYGARSSCFGLIDLDGFRKDRFYLYPSRWRSDFAMAHLLPHWSWPERTGEISPVHLFTSGDEAELFLNGKSLGRKKKGKYECLLRRDEVKYEAGELRAVAYKDGKRWAEDVVKTAGEPCALVLTVDRSCIWVDEKDLAFIT